MVNKAIELLKMLKQDIERNAPLCPFPHRNLIYSVFLNSDRSLKEEFINAFPMDKTDDFYRAILLMGTAHASSGRVPNDIAESMYGGSINRYDLIKIIDEMVIELRKNSEGRSKTMKTDELKEHDVFISHANKDKENFVEDLYQSLRKLGIDIFL